MQRSLLFQILCVLALLVPGLTFGAEQLGEFQFQNFLIEPQFAYRETDALDRGTLRSAKSGFEIATAALGFRWQHDPLISVNLSLGSARLINRPNQFSQPDTQFGLFEAFAELKSGYGTLRAGLIPLFFGSEGRLSESELDFSRSLIFQTREVGLRDLGASYSISHGSFYTQIAVHNGEGGEDTDRRQYQTAIWGWHGPAGLHFGVSALVGRPVETVSGQETRIRMGNAFASLRLYGTGLTLEGTYGDKKTGDVQSPLLGYHIDALHRLSPHLGVQVRYDELDPNRETMGDVVKEWSAGFVFRNEQDTSRVFLIATKRIEEGTPKADDEIRLMWRLNSLRVTSDQFENRF